MSGCEWGSCWPVELVPEEGQGRHILWALMADSVVHTIRVTDVVVI